MMTCGDLQLEFDARACLCVSVRAVRRQCVWSRRRVRRLGRRRHVSLREGLRRRQLSRAAASRPCAPFIFARAPLCVASTACAVCPGGPTTPCRQRRAATPSAAVRRRSTLTAVSFFVCPAATARASVWPTGTVLCVARRFQAGSIETTLASLSLSSFAAPCAPANRAIWARRASRAVLVCGAPRVARRLNCGRRHGHEGESQRASECAERRPPPPA